jgi:hypothetical protein
VGQPKAPPPPSLAVILNMSIAVWPEVAAGIPRIRNAERIKVMKAELNLVLTQNARANIYCKLSDDAGRTGFSVEFKRQARLF